MPHQQPDAIEYSVHHHKEIISILEELKKSRAVVQLFTALGVNNGFSDPASITSANYNGVYRQAQNLLVEYHLHWRWQPPQNCSGQRRRQEVATSTRQQMTP